MLFKQILSQILTVIFQFFNYNSYFIIKNECQPQNEDNIKSALKGENAPSSNKKSVTFGANVIDNEGRPRPESRLLDWGRLSEFEKKMWLDYWAEETREELKFREKERQELLKQKQLEQLPKPSLYDEYSTSSDEDEMRESHNSSNSYDSFLIAAGALILIAGILYGVRKLYIWYSKDMEKKEKEETSEEVKSKINNDDVEKNSNPFDSSNDQNLDD